MCFLLRLASGPVRLRHVLALVPVVGCVLLADQRAVLVNLAVVVLVVVVGIWVGPKAGIPRRFSVTSGHVVLVLLAVLAIGIAVVVVPAAVKKHPAQLPFASSYQSLFHNQGKAESAQDRLNLASEAEQLIPHHVLIGWGLGVEFPFFEAGTRSVQTIAYAHNLVLDIWLRLGLVGLALFTMALGAGVAATYGPGDGRAGPRPRRRGGRPLHHGAPRAPSRRVQVRHALRGQSGPHARLRHLHGRATPPAGLARRGDGVAICRPRPGRGVDMTTLDLGSLVGWAKREHSPTGRGRVSVHVDEAEGPA
jgi:hypothetical protein